jgi:hypothetical protein
MQEYLIKRYSFDELNDEAKEKAIEAARNKLYMSLESYETEEFLRFKLEEELGANPAEIDIHFSLSYSQGDGVALYGKLNKSEAPNLSWIDGVDHIKLVKNSWAHHYSHYNTFNVEFYDENYEEIIYSLIGEPAQVLAEQIRNICGTLENYGYRFIEDNYSEKSAIEYITNNYENVFTIDGTYAPIIVSDTAELV